MTTQGEIELKDTRKRGHVLHKRLGGHVLHKKTRGHVLPKSKMVGLAPPCMLCYCFPVEASLLSVDVRRVQKTELRGRLVKCYG